MLQDQAPASRCFLTPADYRISLSTIACGRTMIWCLRHAAKRPSQGTMMKTFRIATPCLAILAASLTAIAPAWGQELIIEEIIVTASKRPQTLQEIPIAVTVVDADTIEKAQIVDIKDLQSMVPSLRISQLETLVLSLLSVFLLMAFIVRGQHLRSRIFRRLSGSRYCADHRAPCSVRMLLPVS
jgi:hypothetical protein